MSGKRIILNAELDNATENRQTTETLDAANDIVDVSQRAVKHSYHRLTSSIGRRRCGDLRP